MQNKGKSQAQAWHRLLGCIPVMWQTALGFVRCAGMGDCAARAVPGEDVVLVVVPRAATGGSREGGR